MKIKTDYVHWINEFSAIDEDTYDYDQPIGYGKTEAEAIEDLKEQMGELHE